MFSLELLLFICLKFVVVVIIFTLISLLFSYYIHTHESWLLYLWLTIWLLLCYYDLLLLCYVLLVVLFVSIFASFEQNWFFGLKRNGNLLWIFCCCYYFLLFRLLLFFYQTFVLHTHTQRNQNVLDDLAPLRLHNLHTTVFTLLLRWYHIIPTECSELRLHVKYLKKKKHFFSYFLLIDCHN